jgi:hypothetical protein
VLVVRFLGGVGVGAAQHILAAVATNLTRYSSLDTVFRCFSTAAMNPTGKRSFP